MSGRYQLLPPLGEDEYAALRESIATFGVMHPVVVDDDGVVIDGHHRVDVCAELGIDYPTTTLPGLTEEQKIEQALALNLARRHLDAEQRSALVAELRTRGVSIRFVSEQTGIPRSTVQRIASRVPNGTPEYVTGRDGKTYRAERSVDPTASWLPDWHAAGLRPPPTSEALDLGALDDVDLDDVHWQVLVEHAARHRLRSGDTLPPPHTFKPDAPTATARHNRLTLWHLLVDFRMLDFLDWCECAGITIRRSRFVLPERLTYPLGPDEERPPEFDDPEFEHDAALGHYYSWMLRPDGAP